MDDLLDVNCISGIAARLEACCNELLSDVETKHGVMKSSFNKLSNEDAKRNNRKSVGRKSISRIGNTTKTLLILKDYIDNLDDIKKSYTKYFIEKIRKEIELVWDKCCYGEKQRSACSPYFVDVFTEESLQEHEEELRILKDYYYTHKELYTLVGKREKIWSEKVNFENPPDGCSRFENRGGTLIKELKRYQVVEKQLPVTEKQIRMKVKSWEKLQRKPFLVMDLPYIKYIENQKVEYKSQQEKKREAKRLARQEELLAETSNPVTKRTSVYEKPITDDRLKELMEPTESSLLKTRVQCTTTPAPLQLQSISEMPPPRNSVYVPKPNHNESMHSKLSKMNLSSVTQKMDTSSCSVLAPKSSKVLSSSKSDSKLVTGNIARPTASFLLKSRLPKSSSASSIPAKRTKVTLQTDPLKRKQKRRSLGAKKRRSVVTKENYGTDDDR